LLRIKFRTLQASLFMHYSTFFLIVMLSMMVLLYLYFSHNLSKDAANQQIQLCTSIANSIDTEETKMDTVSMNISYSNLIKYHFQKYLELSSFDQSNNISLYSERYSNINTLTDVITAIIGPTAQVSQADIYDTNVGMVGMGRFSGERAVDVSKMDWYQNTMKLGGESYLSTPKEINWLNDTNVSYKGHKYITLTRVYKDSNFVNQGIIEIIQDCDTLFNYVNEIMDKQSDMKIYIIGNEGKGVYPYQSDTNNGTYYYGLIKKSKFAELDTHNVKSADGKSVQAMTYTISRDTGWMILIIQSKSVILESVYRFTVLYLIFTLLAIGITLIISYFVSRNATIPLRHIGNLIKNMELGDLSSHPAIADSEMKGQYVEEIERLHHAFLTMNKKLNTSLNDILTSKAEEMNARMLALQSQMNPHFLYNNLATISIMAEEGMNDQVASLCRNISFMLRYISTDDSKCVPLRDEIDYTKKYIECMRIRYEDNLQCEINIPEILQCIRIPKLILQPLIENSVKFALKATPPWRIYINGSIEGNTWSISVLDNGIGFDADALEKFNAFKKTESIPKLRIGGMGLYNIYIRLKLLYKEKTQFDICNLPNGGACVTIGGEFVTLDMREKDDGEEQI
jgi:two-component system, sensor histidine kinase YesM